MVSIALATYNGERFLKEQLDSILEQSYTDIEIIACDDCSTDSTPQILEDYQKKDSRLKVYFNEKNLGFKKILKSAFLFVKVILLHFQIRTMSGQKII